MKTFPPDKIRNIVLLGHQGSGKTTLAEALLFVSGTITRMGSIQEGNTVCDFEPEEVKKTISVSLSMAPFEWKDHKINLMDSPGYADFIGEAQGALRVADAAVLVISAVDGVQVQHETLWRLARAADIPRFVFINKLDRERADFHEILKQLSDRLGSGFAPVDLPLGEEHDFHGVVDVLSEKAFRYENGKVTSEEDMPPDLKAEVKDLHTKIVESVAETDDDLLERYLGGEDPSSEEVAKGLHEGVCEGNIFPVLVGSATKLIGLDRLADLLIEMAPSPVERGSVSGTMPDSDMIAERRISPDEPLSAFVFKTVSDPYVGRISLFKVISGKLRPTPRSTTSRTRTTSAWHMWLRSGARARSPCRRWWPETSPRWLSCLTRTAGTRWRTRAAPSSTRRSKLPTASSRLPSLPRPKGTTTS